MTDGGDLIEHDTSGDDCICGPRTEYVPATDDHADGWIIVHHSLDGRELQEDAP